MNIRCPNCQTVFRVDPARVPPGGVRARCARCSATFPVTRQDVQPQDPAGTGAAAPGPAAGHQGAAPAPGHQPSREPGTQAAAAQPSTAAGTAVSTESSGGQGSSGATGAAPTGGSTDKGGAAGGAPGSTPSRVPVFGSKDPAARAQRIARALVSDIVAYHPKRREESLGAGTLRADFRDEIMKSWEEYVAQVGLDIAKSTPHFRNALNEILAKGQAVF
jgi:predicted Zn finger-like uncharacterized protein